jgi:hypothetical protein
MTNFNIMDFRLWQCWIFRRKMMLLEYRLIMHCCYLPSTSYFPLGLIGEKTVEILSSPDLRSFGLRRSAPTSFSPRLSTVRPACIFLSTMLKVFSIRWAAYGCSSCWNSKGKRPDFEGVFNRWTSYGCSPCWNSKRKLPDFEGVFNSLNNLRLFILLKFERNAPFKKLRNLSLSLREGPWRLWS